MITTEIREIEKTVMKKEKAMLTHSLYLGP